jgi:hypothetical protein
MGHLVINGTIEVKPGGESKLRIGDEVKANVDLRTTTGQPTSIMVVTPSSLRLQRSPMYGPISHARLDHHRSNRTPFVRSVMPSPPATGL